MDRKILTTSGCYPHQNNINLLLYYTAFLTHLIFASLMVLSTTAYVYSDFENLSKLSESVQLCMIVFSYIFKLLNFVYFKTNFFVIEQLIDDKILQDFTKKHLKWINSELNPIIRAATMFRILVVLSVTFYCLFPYLDTSDVKVLPVASWIPWDIQASKLNYNIAFFYQILTLLLVGTNNTSIDILNVKMISLVSVLFELLKHNLVNLDYNDKERIENKLKKNIQVHQILLKFISMIEISFTYGILIQFVSTVISICFTGFQMLVVPFGSVQFITLTVVLTSILCQVGLYCWFGNDIMYKSTEILQSCYLSNWYESDTKIRNLLIIFMERTKRPVVLTAGKFFSLSLVTFTLIIRSGYSYLTVLQRRYTD